MRDTNVYTCTYVYVRTAVCTCTVGGTSVVVCCISYTLTYMYKLSEDVKRCTYLRICDCLCINHPFTTKCKFWVRPKITAKSAQDRYSVLAIGVIYGVLATLCRSTTLRLRIVSPGATLLLLFMNKECGDVNGTCKRPQSAVKNA